MTGIARWMRCRGPETSGTGTHFGLQRGSYGIMRQVPIQVTWSDPAQGLAWTVCTKTRQSVFLGSMHTFGVKLIIY